MHLLDFELSAIIFKSFSLWLFTFKVLGIDLKIVNLESSVLDLFISSYILTFRYFTTRIIRFFNQSVMKTWRV